MRQQNISKNIKKERQDRKPPATCGNGDIVGHSAAFDTWGKWQCGRQGQHKDTAKKDNTRQNNQTNKNGQKIRQTRINISIFWYEKYHLCIYVCTLGIYVRKVKMKYWAGIKLNPHSGTQCGGGMAMSQGWRCDVAEWTSWHNKVLIKREPRTRMEKYIKIKKTSAGANSRK